jgi:ribosome recycling factor
MAVRGVTAIFIRPSGDSLLPSRIMSPDDILLEAEEKMIKTEQVVIHEFAAVRTGKASASLIENIMVEVYGSQMRIRELAGITTPEPRQLLVQPWDMTSIQAIEKAIQKANLGVSPAVQGKMIRISFPELSTERRQEFVKITKKLAEDGRVAVRHVRRDAMELLKKAKTAGGVGEEELESAEKEIQKLTDQYIGKIDGHVVTKEKEIMTV